MFADVNYKNIIQKCTSYRLNNYTCRHIGMHQVLLSHHMLLGLPTFSEHPVHGRLWYTYHILLQNHVQLGQCILLNLLLLLINCRLKGPKLQNFMIILEYTYYDNLVITPISFAIVPRHVMKQCRKGQDLNRSAYPHHWLRQIALHNLFLFHTLYSWAHLGPEFTNIYSSIHCILRGASRGKITTKYIQFSISNYWVSQLSSPYWHKKVSVFGQ